MMKRLMDLCVSLAGLLILGPLLVFSAIAIKVTSPGSVLYRGNRVGRFGKPFRIFKFRTMVINADKIGGPSTSDDDPRITTVGKLMRKCKLDELPQLINVLTGQMSLVGPRPEVQKYVDMYTTEEKDILNIRPGITDWASIWNSDEGAVLAGHADPDRAYEELIRPTKLKLQLLYARHHNVWIDVKIICYTLLAVVSRGWTPKEISGFPKPGEPVETTDVSDRQEAYDTVTELPGAGATEEQLLMLETRYRVAGDLAEDKDVLEVACGPGIGLKYLASRARRVSAGDYDTALVAAAQSVNGDPIDIRQLDAEALPFEDDSYDVVLLLEAVYYLPNPVAFLNETARVLRPDGALLICSANCQRPDFNPSPFSAGYYSANDLQQMMTSAGFQTEVFGAYGTSHNGSADFIRGLVRTVAVKLRLIPKSMKWKTRIKRLFFGALKPLPSSLDIQLTENETLAPLEADGTEVDSFKVIYAIGRRSVASGMAEIHDAA